MRQFVFAKGSLTDKTLTSAINGQIGVMYNKNGEPVITYTGKEFKAANIVVYRDNDSGGPLVIPIHTNNFSYTYGKYQEGRRFKATITIPSNIVAGDYSVIVVKNGLKFNERNKWTASAHVTKKQADAKSVTAENLAEKIANIINANGFGENGSGVKADVSGATITIEPKKDIDWTDYTILGADEMFDTDTEGNGVAKINYESHGVPPYGDLNYVTDLFEKAAADSGYEYTFRDAYTYLYPGMFGDGKATLNTDSDKFDIFTLRFAEPRSVKTKDDVVNQIIQIVLPKDDPAISTLKTIFNDMAGYITLSQDVLSD